jgi:hypothetical protein
MSMAEELDPAAARRLRNNKITFLAFFVTVSGLTAFDLFIAGRHVGYPSNIGYWMGAFIAATITAAALVAAAVIFLKSRRQPPR